MEAETASRLRITIHRLARLLRPTEAGQAAGITPTKATVLFQAVREGPVRLSDVAEQEGLNPTMLSRTVAKLCDAGLIARSADPDDRRAAWIDATADGRRLAERIRRQRTAAVQAAMAGLASSDQALIEAALPALERLVGELGR